MRILPYILAFCCLLSCTKSVDVTPLLERVEQLLTTHPDSALALLESFPNSENLSSHDRAWWRLLLTQAIDKSYRTHSSDSLIEQSVRYNEKEGDTFRLAVDQYTQSRVYKELQMKKKAANYYRNSRDVVKDGGAYDTPFLSSVELGHIHANSYSIEKAFTAYYQYLTMAELKKDSINLAYAYGYLARLHGLQENWERAIILYQHTIDIGRRMNEITALELGLKEQAAIYAQASLYSSAIQNMRELLQVTSSVDPQNYFTLGNLYQEVNQKDSALFYLNKALDSKNLYTQRSAYYSLYLLHKENQNYEKALHYIDWYWEYADSIQQIELKEELIAVENQFQLEKLEWQKELLKKQHSKNRFRLYMIIAFLSVFLVLGYTFFQHRLHRAHRQELENCRWLDILTTQLQQNEDSIRKKQNEIDQLSLQIGEQREIQYLLAEKQNELKVLQVKNGDLNKRIRKIFDSFEQRGVELASSQALLKQKETWVITTLQTLERHEPIQSDQWELIFSIMDSFYCRFVTQLRELYPELTVEDIRICCLMKLEHTARQIQTELEIQEDTLSKRKQRIREKIDKGRKWKRGELNDFIKNFPN